MAVSTTKPTNKAQTTASVVGGGLILAAIVGMLIFACVAVNGAANLATYGAAHLAQPTVTALPTDMRSLMRGVAAKDSVKLADYTYTGGLLQVTLDAPDGVLGSFVVESNVYDAMRAAYTSPSPPQEMTVVYNALMGDEYGNNVDATVATATLTRQTAAQFNWDSLGITGAWNAYDSVQVSPNL